MKKESAYQKLKRENAMLKERLIEVCLRPESGKSAVIIQGVRLVSELEKAVWHGSTTEETRFQGLLKQIEHGSA